MGRKSVQGGETLEQLRLIVAAESSDGLKLSTNIEDNPICCLSLDESVPCIKVIWKQYATSAQLKFIHEILLEMLQTRGVDRILGDDTELPTIHADDRDWIVQDWMPRAVAAGLRAAANKSSGFYFGKLSTEHVQSLAPPELTLRAFQTMDDARDWLRTI